MYHTRETFPNINFIVFISIGLLYFVLRIYLATASSYGFYHGWNEAYYSSIARNYFTHSLWYHLPIIGDAPLNTVPPFYSYLLFASFNILGISDINARIVSIFSEVIAALAVYLLAHELYNKKIAEIAALVFLFIPWNILWFGRAQTDPLMTALMTSSIALYVYAYKREKSMLPFGILFGLAAFTKQPAFLIILIVAVWSYLAGIKKNTMIKGAIWAFIGLIPLIIWFSYHLINSDIKFLSHLVYGEFALYGPFADFLKVTLLTIVGISPFVLFFALYELGIGEKKANILLIWLIAYGAFVLYRTPPSHEYYSLPLTPVFAVLAAGGIIRISNIAAIRRYLSSKAVFVLTASLILTTIPVTYILLSYSGDIGYTSTRDAGIYLKEYMDKHPEETYLVLTPGRYIPQMVWYANLTSPGYSKRQIYGISNDLSGVSIQDIRNITSTKDATSVFLVVDGRQGFTKMLEQKYEKVYETAYVTDLPNVAGTYTGEGSGEKYFRQDLSIFKLN